MQQRLNRAMKKHTLVYNQNVSRYFNDDNSLQKKEALSFYQYQTLLALFYFESYTIGELARFLKIPSSNVSRVASSLIKRGFCFKKREEGKQAVRLSLSESGRAMLNKDALNKSDKYLELYNKYIPLNEQEELLTLYERITEILLKIPIKDAEKEKNEK